jgi:hypothetical protein
MRHSRPMAKQPQRTLTAQYKLAEECLVKHGIRGADAALADFKRRVGARYRSAVHGDRESYMDDAVFVFSEARAVLAEKLAQG